MTSRHSVRVTQNTPMSGDKAGHLPNLAPQGLNQQKNRRNCKIVQFLRFSVLYTGAKTQGPT